MFLTIAIVAAALHVAILVALASGWRLEHGKLKPAPFSRQGQRPSDGGHTPTELALPRMSVLVAARNEEANLRAFLPGLLTQAFPGEYEVIVALDRCTDGSAQVVAALQERHAHLHALTITDLPTGWTGKKWALNTAVEAARHDCLALTDADCDVPQHWLQAMATALAEGHDLVLGASPYAPRPGLLNLFIRWETFLTGLLYMGLARWGLPYMGVGRSLAYRKAWLKRMGGFGVIAGRLSGDDDLLVNRHRERGGVGVVAELDAQVISAPQTTWRGWFRQKIRHGSAGTAYRKGSLVILSTIHGLHLIFYLSLILALCLQSAGLWALLLYLLRSLAIISTVQAVPWRYKAGFVWAFPLLDVLYLAYLTILMPLSAFMEPKWKDTHGGSV